MDTATQGNTQGTLADFIAEAGIAATVRGVAKNPNLDAVDKWAANHYRVTLRRVRRDPPERGGTYTVGLSVFFSQGTGVLRAPTAADVLDSLATDAQTVANAASFEEWARELGYDADSRKAERTYNLIRSQSLRLEAFLGRALFVRLLDGTERL